ncbi:MAG TPA: hypothetical protein VFE62_08870 [Gemmataceae bacterium]|nr:hypothetical protein [Gemmataceae bacterium]
MTVKYSWALLILMAFSGFASAQDGRCDHNGCPHGIYPIGHYWWPTYYRLRGWVHPSYLDRYPPGPFPPIPPTFEDHRYRCASIPPAPTSAYANPTAYFGRPLAPSSAPAYAAPELYYGRPIMPRN